jgi:hypothetical protein
MGFFQFGESVELLGGVNDPQTDCYPTDEIRDYKLVLGGDIRYTERGGCSNRGTYDAWYSQRRIHVFVVFVCFGVEPLVTLGYIPPFGQHFFVFVGPFDISTSARVARDVIGFDIV